ncbi:MAG: hypothetical protein WBD86_03310 [Microgenomates group bacterium]
MGKDQIAGEGVYNDRRPGGAEIILALLLAAPTFQDVLTATSGLIRFLSLYNFLEKQICVDTLFDILSYFVLINVPTVIRTSSRGDRRYKKEAILWLLGMQDKGE